MEKIFVFIMGAILGSFLNVCIFRLPRRRSIVMPPSFCPACKTPIRWYDNIPLASYVLLMGRCRSCKARISFRYFLVEAATASLVTLLFLSFGLHPKFFSYVILTGALMVATFVDFEIQEIPDEVTFFGMIAGICMALVYPSVLSAGTRLQGAIAAILGILAGGLSIYLMGFFGELVFRKEAMGGGDVKLLAMIGAFLGWKLALFTFFVAPLFGAVVGVALKMKDGREVIPYGPYLSLAALVAVFWGERIFSIFLFGG